MDIFNTEEVMGTVRKYGYEQFRWGFSLGVVVSSLTLIAVLVFFLFKDLP